MPVPSPLPTKVSQTLAVLETEAERRQACSDFLNFYARCQPRFRIAPHIAYLGNLFNQVELTGEPDRALIDLHPGSGKSECLAAWAAYLLARDPNRKVLLVSATQNLANRNISLTP
jgi:hypothetical protein